VNTAQVDRALTIDKNPEVIITVKVEDFVS
jgi:hypothetical protein